MAARVLVVDDQPDICKTYRSYLEKKRPWRVETVSDGRQARSRLNRVNFDVALVDVFMPDVSGIDLLREIRQRQLPTDVVMMTGKATVHLAVRAMKEGAVDFLTKPLPMDHLVDAIEPLLEQRRPTPHALAHKLDTYVQQHAYDSKLQLTDLCRAFGLSQRYVCQLFKEEVGQTFRRRLTMYRVELAKDLLARRDRSLEQVAVESGFSSQTYFGQVFRRVAGCAPGGWGRG